MLWQDKNCCFYLLIMSFPGICGVSVVFFFIFQFLGFSFYISLLMLMKNCYTYDRLYDFPPLCTQFVYYCIRWHLNQMLLTPSCYQQLRPKIFIVTLLSMQVRALQITETEFPAIVLFFFAFYTAKKRRIMGIQNKRKFIRKWWLGKML